MEGVALLINIDGWFAGGKSVLWSLLDGHPDVFVNPVHDYSFSLLLTHDDSEEWIKKKYSTTLRKTLAMAEYFKLEKIMYDGYLPIHFSADVHYKLPFNFDFYSFDRHFMQALHKRDKWSVACIIEDLYESLRVVWQKDTSPKKPKYYAAMSHPRYFVHYHKIPHLIPDMKNILVKRDIRSIIATRTNRTERPRDLNECQAFRTPFEKVIKSQEIKHICSFFNAYEELALRHPDNFIIVDFNQLVSTPEAEMQRISSFLEIEYMPILSTPTRDGVLLECEGLSFIGQENDTWEKLLTKKEQAILQMEVERAKHGDVSVHVDYSDNYKTSELISKSYSAASLALAKKKKIAIFGNGTSGKFFASQFSERVVAIFDRSATECTGIVKPLKYLSLMEYDALFISVLGREPEIISELIHYHKVPIEKIVTIVL